MYKLGVGVFSEPVIIDARTSMQRIKINLPSNGNQAIMASVLLSVRFLR